MNYWSDIHGILKKMRTIIYIKTHISFIVIYRFTYIEGRDSSRILLKFPFDCFYFLSKRGSR